MILISVMFINLTWGEGLLEAWILGPIIGHLNLLVPDGVSEKVVLLLFLNKQSQVILWQVAYESHFKRLSYLWHMQRACLNNELNSAVQFTVVSILQICKVNKCFVLREQR